MNAKVTGVIITVLIVAIISGGGFILYRSRQKLEPPPTVETKPVLIRVTYPLPNDVVTSPIAIRGEARGMWYFEASFPVVLTDWDGLIIAEGHATADGDWMTPEFVPFTATLTFTKPSYGNRGTLILRKDNPSGLPEHDEAIEIPVLFGK